MRHHFLVVPAALAAPAIVRDLLRDTALPCLAEYWRRASGDETRAAGPLTTALQTWVFGNDANLAEAWARACGKPALAQGGRWVAEPAHFEIANDHLRLDDPAKLDRTPDEARALFDSAAPVLAAAGWQPEPLAPTAPWRWFLSRHDGMALDAPSLECAVDDNVAQWQPRAPDGRDPGPALAWRRCVNEIQMLWFDHPVNRAREARGAPTLNTLWLTGTGAALERPAPFRVVASSHPLLVALPHDPASERELESFDALIEPARKQDWSTWRERLVDLDARVAGLAGADASVVLCGRRWSRTIRRAPRDRWRIWRSRQRRGTAAELFVEPA